MNRFPPEYCSFNDKAQEFIIKKPDTPRPWQNRLWNNLLSVQVSNHGSAKVYERDLGEGYYAYNTSGNRCVYVHDRDNGDLWSPGWLPVRRDLDEYEVRHGLNYTIIKGSLNGLTLSWINTVHPTHACELWRLRIKNNSSKKRCVDLVPFYEIGLSFRDAYFHGSPDLFKSEYDQDQRLFFTKNFSRLRDNERYALAYSSNRPVDSFELSMEGFLRDYGSLQAPRVIIDDRFGNSMPDRATPVFAMRYKQDLNPGESREISIQLYGAESFEQAMEKRELLSREGIITRSLAIHREQANQYLSSSCILTGDKALDRFVNLWVKHQLRYNVFWNREEFGMGFRDVMQDCDSYVLFDPLKCRSLLLEAARHIYPDGHTVRKWSRLDDKMYFDGGIWFVNTLCKYIRETGDLLILEETCTYFQSDEADTVLLHARRALDFLINNRGPDGLCRMGFGDWNDALNGVDREGRGQSVWTTMAMVWAMRSFVELLDHIGDGYRGSYEQMMGEFEDILNQKCFEGDRYIRAITDAGEKVGSSSCSEGKIYLNAQSWAMISRISSKSHVAKILETVKEQLYTDFGPVLLNPVYTSHRPDIGRITSDPPGFVENGACYVHAAMFHCYGLVISGYPDRALELIHTLLPSSSTNGSEKSGLEPYQITNAYEGPASNHPGRAMFPWRTGSAGWFLKVFWDGFIGIRPTLTGLLVDPKIPESWSDVVVAERKVRGNRYTFEIVRGDERSSRQVDMEVSVGDLIPYEALNPNMTIRVTI